MIRSFGAVVSVALLVAAACRQAPPPAPPPPQVTVAPVVERQVDDWEEFTGRLQAVDAVEIRPRVSGYIQKLAFTEGREVKKGDVLFVIDPRPYQAEYDRAQAQLQQAQSRSVLAKQDLERAQTLVAKQAISREEFDQRTSGQTETEAAIRAAQAALTTARLNLEWTRVRAPIAGRVSRAEVTEGNLVQAGPPSATLLTTVVSLDPIYLYFDTDEQTFLKYGAATRGDGRRAWRDGRRPVFMGLANEQGYPHEGRLDFVDNQVDPSSGTIRARAVFENDNRIFTPGLFARVKVVSGRKAPAVLVRDAAIGTDQDKRFVLVLKPDATLDYRPVTLGRIADGLRQITSGLKPGEKVVVNGLQRVRPGAKVQATVVAMAEDSTTTTAGATAGSR